VDAIAELERQLQAAASHPEAGERAAKLRSIRGRISSLLGEADRHLSDAHRVREAEAMGLERLRLEARGDADLREAALADGDLTAEELDESGFLGHAELDRLEEEGLLDEALLGRGLRSLRGFEAKLHPRVMKGRRGGGQFAEKPGGPGPPGRRTPPTERPERPGRGRLLTEPKAPRGREVSEIVVRKPKPGSKPIVTDDVEEALRLLEQGKHVQLDQPRTVSVLIERMNEIVEEAKAAGVDAPDYDLCNVTVKGTNIFCAEHKGIPRLRMPQLKGYPTEGSRADAMPRDRRGEVDLAEQFRQHLLDGGVQVARRREQATHLKASQRELNGVKVAGIANYLASGGEIEGPPIFVSRNLYVVDGHHRWAAEVAEDFKDGKPDAQMDVDVIDLDILDLLAEANAFAAEWGIPQQSAANAPEPGQPKPRVRKGTRPGKS
jgi:hypothetical protein